MAEDRTTCPAARSERLLIEEVDGELLIYDLDRQKAHCLNPAASAVWKACDGATSMQAIASLAGRSLGASMDTDAAQLAIEELGRKHLLKNVTAAKPGESPRITRRDLIQRAGGITLAAAVPIIASLAVPEAAHAASCVTSGGDCSTFACCSGLTCGKVTPNICG
ncbi:MAG: PqqD family peptide modification chaperone [Chloroflexi bacterium]|nr:PqqD family peptide modification chaperone [Chloroflexota bacterium]